MSIMRKLTHKSLKLNKTRTIATLIGILLSTALIFTVAGGLTSAVGTAYEYAKDSYGDYDFCVSGDFGSTEVKKLSENRDIASIYQSKYYGVAKFENSKSAYNEYMLVRGLDSKAFSDCFDFRLKEGRYPEKNDEILLSPEFVKYSSKKYAVGDKITLNMGTMLIKADPSIGVKEDTPTYVLLEDDEVSYFQPEFEKTFTVVGIADKISTYLNTSYLFNDVNLYTYYDVKDNAQAVKGYDDETCLYLKFTDEAAQNFDATVANILQVNPDYMQNSYITYEYENSNADAAEIEKKFREEFSKNEYKIQAFDSNYNLKGFKDSIKLEFDYDHWSTGETIICLALIIIVIIVLSTIFIIRNSFAISITEKTRYYGMLSSIGASPRQIRNNVFYEALVLGAIGIAAGILLGMAAIAVLLWIVGSLMYDQLDGAILIFDVPYYIYLGTILFAGITIFLASLPTAVRASHIAPIEAIRSNKDIKLSKRQIRRKLKSPKIIDKMFGVGGRIAWKNLQRSKSKYRTTVISLVVSITVFITASSLISYEKASVQQYTDEHYNLTVNNPELNLNHQEDIRQDGPDTTEKDIKNTLSMYNEIKKLDSVEKISAVFSHYGVLLKVKSDTLSQEAFDSISSGVSDSIDTTNDANQEVREYLGEKGYTNVMCQIIAVDDATYKKIVEKLGYDYQNVKGKGIFQNTVDIYAAPQHIKQVNVFDKDMVGSSVEVVTTEDMYDEEKDESVIKLHHSEIEIAGLMKKNVVDRYSEFLNITYEPYLLVDLDWYRANGEMLNTSYSSIYINSTDPDTIEQRLVDSNPDISIRNQDKTLRQQHAAILVVEIFIYGFILIISLIGITNIFNTITTNVRLRSKEYAMLQSVGVTKGEFSRMTRLEIMMYTFKSLIIGIPLGLLGSYGIYKSIVGNDFNDIDYIFPLAAVLVSAVAVILIVSLIMYFSISKIRKQNIIETIRNENI